MIVVKTMDEQLHSKKFIELQKRNILSLRENYGIAAEFKDLVFGKRKPGIYDTVIIIEVPDNTSNEFLDNFDLKKFDEVLSIRPTYFDNDVIATYSMLEDEDLKNVIYRR